jgi:hypothetical protein
VLYFRQQLHQTIAITLGRPFDSTKVLPARLESLIVQLDGMLAALTEASAALMIMRRDPSSTAAATMPSMKGGAISSPE